MLNWVEHAIGDADGRKHHLKDYACQKWSYDKDVPKNTKVWLARCLKLAKQLKADGSLLAFSQRLARASGVSPTKQAYRRTGQQGRPFKAAVLRQALFEYFVSIRASVAARIPPRFLILKAKAMAEECLAEMRSRGEFIDLPTIGKHWLQRWRNYYGISLRKPNRKFKVKLATLRGRLKSMWLTASRIRALAECTLGHDLSIDGIDQKGIHMNELGSKNVGVLTLKGAPDVPVKENHSASRQRLTIMTLVTSDLERASAQGGPVVEVMFKGKSTRTIKDLDIPDGVNVSLFR